LGRNKMRKVQAERIIKRKKLTIELLKTNS